MLILRAIGLLLTLVLTPLIQVAQQPVIDDRKVYVVGQVVNPMAMPLKDSITLTQALSLAGGPLRDAKYDKVNIIRSLDSYRMMTCASLRKINKHRTSDVRLQTNDILEVMRGACFRPMSWEVIPISNQPPLRVIR